MNINEIALAGADCFVAGSAVFSSPDPDGHYRQVIKQLRQAIDGTHEHSPNGGNAPSPDGVHALSTNGRV